jgi:hypothetical protein
MQAWNEYIDFDFVVCQLASEIRSDDEDYIKRKCRARINMAGTYALLIGKGTRSKHKYVRWEAEVAIEKECTVIGVNLDGSRRVVDATCPPIIRDIGALFVPFSPDVLAYALEHYKMHDSGAYHYPDEVYRKLGCWTRACAWISIATSRTAGRCRLSSWRARSADARQRRGHLDERAAQQGDGRIEADSVDKPSSGWCPRSRVHEG